MFALCVASLARAGDDNKSASRTWTGEFVKVDDKVVFKHGNDNHAFVAAETASDEVKAEVTSAEKDLVGKGKFDVTGTIRKEGTVVTIYINTVSKKE